MSVHCPSAAAISGVRSLLYLKLLLAVVVDVPPVLLALLVVDVDRLLLLLIPRLLLVTAVATCQMLFNGM